jgi:5-methylcytosine-specific restriction endonuclease McrA
MIEMLVRRMLMVATIAVLLSLPASALAFTYPGTSTYAPYPVDPGTGGSKAVKPKANPYGLVHPTYVPAGVTPDGSHTTPITPGSKGATATYNLDWTIGTTGKSGCLVCHGDKNLVRIIGGRAVSMYVNSELLKDSAHAKLLCTDCHTDFAFRGQPHVNGQLDENWRTVAKTACKNCHQPEFLEWGKSAHSTAGSVSETSTLGKPNSSAPGKPRPTCGDCHDGHTIPRKDDVAGEAKIHASALAMCGKCHVEAAEEYTDYYHGAAYRRGAPDAPACWQCHNTHAVLPSSDKAASTYADNLTTTCSKCHKAAPSAGYVQYAQLIHARREVFAKNPIFSVVDTATTTIESVFRSVFAVFQKGS